MKASFNINDELTESGSLGGISTFNQLNTFKVTRNTWARKEVGVDGRNREGVVPTNERADRMTLKVRGTNHGQGGNFISTTGNQALSNKTGGGDIGVGCLKPT